AIAVAPTNPSTIFIGADDESSGGIYKSTDGGSTWISANSGLNSDPRVHALAVDPQNPRSVFAGTRSAGIYKSVDGGNAWIATAGLKSLLITAIAVDPVTSATVYAGTDGGGAYKSTNSGSTWNPINAGLTGTDVRAIAIDPATPSTVYI